MLKTPFQTSLRWFMFSVFALFNGFPKGFSGCCPPKIPRSYQRFFPFNDKCLK